MRLTHPSSWPSSSDLGLNLTASSQGRPALTPNRRKTARRIPLSLSNHPTCRISPHLPPFTPLAPFHPTCPISPHLPHPTQYLSPSATRPPPLIFSLHSHISQSYPFPFHQLPHRFQPIFSTSILDLRFSPTCMVVSTFTFVVVNPPS